jgi:hypothetical protein
MALLTQHIGILPGAILVTGFLTSLAVVISISSALPWVRNRYHKYVCRVVVSFMHLLTTDPSVFEQNHRIAGWYVFHVMSYCILNIHIFPQVRSILQ